MNQRQMPNQVEMPIRRLASTSRGYFNETDPNLLFIIFVFYFTN